MEIEKANYKVADMTPNTTSAPPPEPHMSTESSGKASEEVVDESYAPQKLPNAKEYLEKAAKYADKKPKKEAKGKAAKTSEGDGKSPELAVETAPEDQKPGETVEYKANPKFTAVGKEYTLPQWAQDIIKDEASEKEVKEVFQKAMGLDHVKMRQQELYDQHTTLSKTHNELVEGVQELRSIYQGAVQTGNLLALDDFFAKLQIPPQVILNYALQRVQFEEAPQEQKQMVMGQLEAQRRAKELEKQNQALETNASVAESRARAMQLDQVLTRPDVESLIKAFDSAPGRKPGDFRERVRQHGEYTWYKSQGKQDLTPEQAVQEVIQMFGLNVQSPQAPAPQTQAEPAPKAQTVAPHRNVPTIPTINGKSSSPMKKSPSSIDELRQMARDALQG